MAFNRCSNLDTGLARTGAWRRLDRVWGVSAVLFAALLVLWPGQAARSLVFTLDALWLTAPFILASALFAAAIAAAGADAWLARPMKARPLPAIVAAATFGALSPFCSLSVIPVAGALLAAGVPLAPIMAFWLGSPLMDPEMFVLTVAIVDLPFAVTRTLAAIAVGLAAGFATHVAARAGALSSPMRAAGWGGAGANVWTGCGGLAAGTGAEFRLAFWRRAEGRAEFAARARAIAPFLVKWLFLAFAIESLIVAWVPAEEVAASLGGAGWWAIPAGAALGIPVYVNGYAATPTVSALLDMGMRPGAALAFLTAGEVTSIPTALSVLVLVRRGVFLWYLFLGLAGAVLVGFACEAWLGL